MRNSDPALPERPMCLDSREVAEGAPQGFFSASFPSADALVTKDEKPELS